MKTNKYSKHWNAVHWMQTKKKEKHKIASELFGKLSSGIHQKVQFFFFVNHLFTGQFHFEKETKKVLTIIESQKSTQHIMLRDTGHWCMWQMVHLFFIFLRNSVIIVYSVPQIWNKMAFVSFYKGMNIILIVTPHSDFWD